MEASTFSRRDHGLETRDPSRIRALQFAGRKQNSGLRPALWTAFNGWFDMIAPCPWSAHVGLSAVGTHTAWTDQATVRLDLSRKPLADKTLADGKSLRRPLYTPEERHRRDATPWTLVQAILAPIQFLAFAVSLVLILRYMATGQGYAAATASILVKTALLYAIMITGSVWEKVVFGKWLFASSFFWEDAFSMLVLGLQTAYLTTLLLGLGTPVQQMLIAIAAYAAYAINAAQFLLKLRAARLEAADPSYAAA
jgi:3-vinyl bacteriochlorophyllide hydratase